MVQLGLMDCSVQTSFVVNTSSVPVYQYIKRIFSKLNRSVAKDVMPFVHVTSNVPKTDVDVPKALRALSNALSDALGKPEAYVMVQLDLDMPMIFQASDAPCAFIHIRSIGRIGPDLNPKTAASLTATAAKALKLPSDRVFLNLDDLDATNWGMAGNILG
ncbi:Macrophage migration inhibitory factor domain-containing protein [Phytophthora infestans]|nr:Macrophage migration inhibitory factor domain-containing protein [Phytophthora infestans]